MILENIIGWLVPFVLTGISTFIVKKIKNLHTLIEVNEKHDLATKNGVLAILRSQIVSKSERYIAIGYLPDYARHTLSELVSAYKELGGNHAIDKLAEQCYSLPPKLENITVE